MVGVAKHRTQADDNRFAIIRDIGCLAHLIDGWPEVPCQIHHELDDDGQRFDDEHRHTIGLCPWHHVGEVPPKCRGSVTRALVIHGPSLARHPRLFADRYGGREQRLIMQDSLVRMVASAQRRGAYIPPADLVKIAGQLHSEVVQR